MQSLALKERQANRMVFILSILGVIMAIYVLQSFLRQSSIICLTSGCELVRKNPASYILGIPVPAFGLVGYTLLAILAFTRTVNKDPIFFKLMLGVAIFGVAFVSWFTYTEIFVIKAICTWCAISALNMLTIFVILLTNLRKYESLK